MSIAQKGLQHWLPSYIWESLFSRKRVDSSRPVHVFLCFVDHFEPFHSGVDRERAANRVKAWVEGYPRMADRHRDSDGKPPQHTWFYPPHLDHAFLEDLVGLCRRGYGEVEMHLHHNHMHPFPDTSDTLREKICTCIEDFSRYGVFCLPDGSKRYAFIHGDWSLDNARGDKICGVNNEITLLRETGCYADFTFPSLGISQPAMINTMYYVKDDPFRPKSYNWGRPVRVGGKPWGDLMLIQGIIGLRWRSRIHKLKPSIEASNIDRSDYPFLERIDYWVQNAVRIKGQPNWLFIKLHTHGSREVDFDCLIGNRADAMYSYLEKKCIQSDSFNLHYVTAREMYNLIKAAEAGLQGDPGGYRDFAIAKYIYLDS